VVHLAGGRGRAGCRGGTTPLNATHDAGVHILNTGNFPDLVGPLDELRGHL
jgi:hypothetical protein